MERRKGNALIAEAELERERSILRSEYEEKLQQMQKDIEKEQETNAKVAAEMENLRRAYQDELQKINSESMRKVQASNDYFNLSLIHLRYY